MNMRLTVLLFLLIVAFTLSAQLTVRLPDGKKGSYALGETLRVQVMVKSRPETCLDGMKRTKLYFSGLKVVQQSDWKQTSPAVFRKELVLMLVAGRKPQARITVLRKTDKENFFAQEILAVTQP